MKKPEYIRKDFPDSALLGEAREWTRKNAYRGCLCPLCTSKLKLYSRTLSIAPAKVMVELYKRDEGREFLHLPRILDTMKGTAHQGGYGTLGEHWGLIERMDGIREDGSHRVGWWRLTDKGRMFVRGEITVPKKANIFMGRLVHYEGPAITISDALKEPFDYRSL